MMLMVLMMQLARLKYASVTSYEGRVSLNLRHYFQSKKGDIIPTKKGITLSKEQFQILIDSAPLLMAQFAEQEALVTSAAK
jgi:hypothetical protein